jgi:hypothetical protein
MRALLRSDEKIERPAAGDPPRLTDRREQRRGGARLERVPRTGGGTKQVGHRSGL